MKAILLAAGQSKRLYPLTKELPKCLLPIDGKAIIDHQLEALVAHGVEKVVVVVGCKQELVRAHLDQKAYPIRVTYVMNEAYETTGPVLGGLAKVMEHLHDPLLFFHCDVLFDADAVGALLAYPDETALLYRKNAWDEEAGKIVVRDGRAIELGKHIEHERASGEYLQVAKFGDAFLAELRSVLESRIRDGRDGYTIDAFNEAAQRADVSALPFDGVALEIDTPEDYAAAKEVWEKRA